MLLHSPKNCGCPEQIGGRTPACGRDRQYEDRFKEEAGESNGSTAVKRVADQKQQVQAPVKRVAGNSTGPALGQGVSGESNKPSDSWVGQKIDRLVH